MPTLETAKLEGTLRPVTEQDIPACAQIVFDAFKSIATAHNFPLDFTAYEAALGLTDMFTRHPHIYGVAFEQAGKIVGSNFLDERDEIRGVGPITVDPSVQHKGIGRLLMKDVIKRGSNAKGIRLVQDAFNVTSYSLYSSLGFAVKEPLMLMNGWPKSEAVKGYTVREMTLKDIPECAKLCHDVHGIYRSGELEDASKVFKAFVAIKNNEIKAYASSVTFWPLNHAVAKSESDMQALLLGAASQMNEPLSFIMATRQSNFYRWALSEGFRNVKPMTLMTMGYYQEPNGVYYPSVVY